MLELLAVILFIEGVGAHCLACQHTSFPKCIMVNAVHGNIYIHNSLEFFTKLVQPVLAISIHVFLDYCPSSVESNRLFGVAGNAARSLIRSVPLTEHRCINQSLSAQ